MRVSDLPDVVTDKSSFALPAYRALDDVASRINSALVSVADAMSAGQAAFQSLSVAQSALSDLDHYSKSAGEIIEDLYSSNIAEALAFPWARLIPTFDDYASMELEDQAVGILTHRRILRFRRLSRHLERQRASAHDPLIERSAHPLEQLTTTDHHIVQAFERVQRQKQWIPFVYRKRTYGGCTVLRSSNDDDGVSVLSMLRIYRNVSEGSSLSFSMS